MGRTFAYGSLVLVLLLLLTVLIRLPLLSQPYHQDEYKWAFIVNPEYGLTGTLPHPPLSEMLYHWTGVVFGYDDLRVLPFVLSIAFSILLYLYMRRFFDIRAAFVALGLWAIDLYALVASAQIDIDGVLLPIWALVTIWAYERWRHEGYSHHAGGLFLLGLVGGAFTKLSFILVPAAIIADLVWSHRRWVWERVSLRVAGVAALVTLMSAAAVYFLRDALIFEYATKFIFSTDRSWFQLLFLSAKAAIYLSPLLVFGVALGMRSLKELSVWYWYVLGGVLFYAVVFDFTHTTMDRYWMVLIMPFIVLTSVTLVRFFDELQPTVREWLRGAVILGGVAAVSLFVFALPKSTVPLQPKTAFLEHFVTGSWSIVIPLTGGSGPLGFYLPLDGIALLWVVALLATGVLLFFRSRRVRLYALASFLGASLTYNALGAIEYATGHFYGSTPKVYRDLVDRVNNDSAIPQVITYYDTAAYELTEAGKYFKRLYTDPMFAESNIEKLSAYSGHFLILDMPEINKESEYWRYFEKCAPLYETHDNLVAGYVFDCREEAFEGI